MKVIDIPLSSILVDNRDRKEFVEITQLAESLKHLGQLVPIIVNALPDGTFRLVAGERRLRAAKEAGWTTIAAVEKKDLDELHLKELELEENLQRSDLTWQERTAAIANIHKMKQALYGEALPGFKDDTGWSLRDTAISIDRSLGGVAESVLLNEAMAVLPELAKEKSAAAALKKYKWMRRQAGDILTASLLSSKEETTSPLSLHNADCFDILKTLPDNSIDFVLTDPPWGIDIGKSGMFSRAAARPTENLPFQDDALSALHNMDRLLQEASRLLRPDRHMILFIGEQHATSILTMASKYFDNVNPVPGIWDKMAPGRPTVNSLSSQHELFLHFSKGARRIVPHSTLFYHERVPSNVSIHVNQKPVSLLRELIEVFSVLGESVLDPFMGSGSSMAACLQAGRRGIGIEMDKVTFMRAQAFISSFSTWTPEDEDEPA